MAGRKMRLLATLVLLLAACGANEGDQVSDRPTPSISEAAASTIPSSIAIPEGTWSGQGMVGLAWYTVRVTLPTECVAGERCGREVLIPKNDRPCAGPLAFRTVSEEESFSFVGSGCLPIDPVLVLEGRNLRYEWGEEPAITLVPSGS